jgi:hypothetical protein
MITVVSTASTSLNLMPDSSRRTKHLMSTRPTSTMLSSLYTIDCVGASSVYPVWESKSILMPCYVTNLYLGVLQTHPHSYLQLMHQDLRNNLTPGSASLGPSYDLCVKSKAGPHSYFRTILILITLLLTLFILIPVLEPRICNKSAIT